MPVYLSLTGFSQGPKGISNVLENDRSTDFNGVILLSQCLSYDSYSDTPQFNPGGDLSYQLGLPTYAATAWYHHKLPDAPADLSSLLTEVEHFAMNDYAVALGAGNTLPADQRHAIAEKLHRYTGLPVDYILKADLRVDGGMFERTLLGADGETTGRFDTRFAGPSIDPLDKEADYESRLELYKQRKPARVAGSASQ